MPVSRKRRLLALYLDYLLFSTAFALVAWLIEQVAGLALPAVVEIALFVGLEVVATRLGWSPGIWVLGIGHNGVDLHIARREAWWTILAGTLLVLEGSKNLVRWTAELPPPPIFGNSLPEALQLTLLSALGIANMLAGVQVLRTRLAGPLLGGAVLLIELASSVCFQTAYTAWVPRAVEARREAQGVPIRDGEVQAMQALFGVYLPVAIALGAVLLAAVAWRFRPHDQQPATG